MLLLHRTGRAQELGSRGRLFSGVYGLWIMYFVAGGSIFICASVKSQQIHSKRRQRRFTNNITCTYKSRVEEQDNIGCRVCSPWSIYEVVLLVLHKFILVWEFISGWFSQRKYFNIFNFCLFHFLIRSTWIRLHVIFNYYSTCNWNNKSCSSSHRKERGTNMNRRWRWYVDFLALTLL